MTISPDHVETIKHCILAGDSNMDICAKFGNIYSAAQIELVREVVERESGGTYRDINQAAQEAASAQKITVKYVSSDNAVSVDRYLEALASIRDEVSIFASDNRLVNLADQKYMAKVWETGDNGEKKAVEREHSIFGTSTLTALVLDDTISRRIETQTLQGGQNGGPKHWAPASVPAKVSATIISRSESAQSFRRLNGIVGCPSLRPDGSLLIKPGHDPETGYYLACDGGALKDINEWQNTMLANPTEEQAKAMLRHLRRLLSGFPFHDVEGNGRGRTLYEIEEEPVTLSESVALTGLLTSICRPMFEVVPAFCVSANGFGVGKTYLSELIGYLATGTRLPSYYWSSSREENDKLLTTLLLKGISFGILDNINGGLTSTLLGQMITTQRPEPRILGVNETVGVKQWSTIFLNGVNIAPSEDLERRMLYLSMMTNSERPQDRVFTTNPMALAQQNRGQYILAALTIVRWHMLQGGKLPKGVTPLGTFEEWSNAVVGALMRLGCPNPILTQSRIKDNSVSATSDAALFRAIHDEFGTCRTTAEKMRATAIDNPNGSLFASLLALGRSTMLPSARSIGMILTNKADTINGSLKLRRTKNRTDTWEYWIAPLE